MRGNSSLAAAMALLAAAAAACGTTVPMDQVARAQAGSTGLSDGTGTTGVNGGLSATGQSDGTTGTVSGGAPNATAASGGSSPGSTATTGAGPSTGPSKPSTNAGIGSAARGPIKIGALTVTGAASYQKSLGFSGATGDQTAMTQSVVNYINAHGGFAGRRVQLVTYDLDPSAAAANMSTAMQAACTFFTQDNKVAALASYVALAPESFYSCLAKAHVPVVSPDEGVSHDFFQILR